ncbi:MAG TPA: hypothetical protein VKJ65_00495, partial [Phycisphaerae bacterium]|nr:hypothetical protein [Phycisphaerae bacterium]
LGNATVPGAVAGVHTDDAELFGADARPSAPDARAPQIKRGQNLFSDLVLAGPAPAPLLRAETFYRYQIMLRTRAMSALSRELARMIQSLTLPEDITLTVDIDPVNLG